MSDAPARIGRYDVLGRVAGGAMGTIYKGHDPDIDRLVALKLIRADLLDGCDRPEFIARFRREAQAAARCAHPNIVAVYDFGLHEGNPFLAMEFVDGITFAQVIQSKARLSVADVAHLMIQVLAGLQAAHATGVVHRDIKPANILLLDGRAVKVTDFGISRVEASNLTMGDAVIGTPNYMSPQQFNAEPVDGRSDLFSLSVVFYELLAGVRPFAGGNATQMYARLLYEPPPDLRPVRPDVTDRLWAVIERGLAKLPEQRFASAAEMSAAIVAALSDTPNAAHAGSDDTTIRVPPERQALAPGPGTMTADNDPELVAALTRSLSTHLGPIARRVVLEAIRNAHDIGGLLDSLAARIERDEDRQAFLQSARRQFAGGSGTTMGGTRIGGPISPEDIERVQKALARHLGPVSRVLIKRALPQSADLAALCLSLAASIDDPKLRTAFLNESQKSG